MNECRQEAKADRLADGERKKAVCMCILYDYKRSLVIVHVYCNGVVVSNTFLAVYLAVQTWTRINHEPTEASCIVERYDKFVFDTTRERKLNTDASNAL